MRTTVLAAAITLGLAVAAPTQAAESSPVVKTARAGPVDNSSQNSDEFIWNLFTQFTALADPGTARPVVFETWASDADTFSKTPAWPAPDAGRRFQSSPLRAATTAHGGPVDIPCSTPGNAAVGGFPTSGTPTPCIAEEVRRNRPQFDYIVGNGLNTQTGLAAAHAKGMDVQMPTEAIAVKGDWVPVQTLLQWIPSIGSLDKLRTLYYTDVSDGVEYAVVSMHVSSRQNPNWVWGSFEHRLTPGRCDDLGCFDSFGATVPEVMPNRSAINTDYGPCDKTEALQTLMQQAGLSPVWQNYCLKSTQVDYVAPDGTPSVLGNAVIERIVGNGTVAASSCIACHAYASFGANGQPSKAAVAMLPYNPTGAPIPAVLEGSLQFDFMWGVLLAPE